MQHGLSSGMFNITIKNGGAVTIGITIGAMIKAGISIGMDVRVNNRWRLIRGEKLTLKIKCLPFMFLEQSFDVWASYIFNAVYKQNLLTIKWST